MTHLVEEAKKFAINAHNSINQKRKYVDDPYHVHPERVASIVASVTDDAEMIAAAWLHDVLEDVAPTNSDFNEQAILAAFGPRVLQLVLEVTDVSKAEDGNRAKRKAIDREHLRHASAAGQTIKLADIIDNLTDIAQHDPHFAKVFKNEATLILPLLKQGNGLLYEKLTNILCGKE
jgi:(p)ppGpp synthase/HD superfamily hydrolase